MPTIHLETLIKAPIESCFDLARDIDFHSISVSHTHENAIAGVTSGKINLNETVTWEAKHFGIKQQLTSKITILRFPNHFRDEMLRGAFKCIVHDHYFETHEKGTLMVDHFYFESPYGFIGKIFNCFVLTNYMKRFLEKRNHHLKITLENQFSKQN